jgi:hypothetical protein
VWNKNPIRFYCREKIKTQKDWQYNIPKISVEQIKGNGEFHFYLYPLGHLARRRFLRSFQSTCGPCSLMCANVWSMNELIFNSEWIKIKLRMNLDLIKSELKLNYELIKSELKVN